jgi:hypothetical protein
MPDIEDDGEEDADTPGRGGRRRGGLLCEWDEGERSVETAVQNQSWNLHHRSSRRTLRCGSEGGIPV